MIRKLGPFTVMVKFVSAGGIAWVLEVTPTRSKQTDSAPNAFRTLITLITPGIRAEDILCDPVRRRRVLPSLPGKTTHLFLRGPRSFLVRASRELGLPNKKELC